MNMKELIDIASSRSNIDFNILHGIHVYLHHMYLHRPGEPITAIMLCELLKEDASMVLGYIRLLRDEGVIEFKISDDKVNVWIFPSSSILRFLMVP